MHSGMSLLQTPSLSRNVSQSSQCAGSTAELATTRKSFKNDELSTSHFFVPIALESLDPVCSQALSFLCELGQRMSAVFGDVRETAHRFQRLLITMLHFNCAMFKCSFTDTEIDCDEWA